MTKIIISGCEARNKLLSGIKKLSNAVKITLGPKGRNALLSTANSSSPLITNDGVTIAKSITLSDPLENMGAEIIKEVSIKTNDQAGDGTTTACVLASALLEKGERAIKRGANPLELKRGMQKATDFASKRMQELSRPIQSPAEIAQVASISAGDEQIGKLIADAFSQVGKDGIITIAESKTMQTDFTLCKGMQLKRGFISSYMATNADKMTAELENPYFLITDKTISSIKEILPIIEELAQKKASLVIVAQDIEGDALTSIVLNKMRGIFNCVAIKAPEFGDLRREILNDLAIFTGATYVATEEGIDLSTCKTDILGSAKKCEISTDNTIIIRGNGDKIKIENRIKSLREKILKSTDQHERDNMQKRLAHLSGGIAIVNVGAPTEIEMQEKKLRIEDALSATKSASSEGILAGGGTTLLNLSYEIKKFAESLKQDEKLGAQIIAFALCEPIKQICKNACKDSKKVIKKLRNSLDHNIGYNALTDEYVDMFQSGVIDPTKVSRSALTNASSVVSTLLTTECVICEQ